MPFAARLGAGLSCLLIAQAGWPGAPPPAKPLDLLLTRDELRAIAERYVPVDPEAAKADELEQVEVRASPELAPMRDRSQAVAGGIAAPFWAFVHPKDAWRIFLPIPPKDNPP